MSTIEKGSTVLVTGANGYIAGHVCDQLLQAGYKVRGTVRSHEKAKWMYELFDKKYGSGKFEAVQVKDMIHDGAFDEAVKGVSGICHLASVLTFSNKVEEVVPPVVKGTLSILTSATKEPGIRSFVLTSSSTAALPPSINKEVSITKDEFNDFAVKTAYESKDPDSYIVYMASKTEGERALWKAVKETNPPFQVSAVLPSANMGEILQPGGSMSASTGSWIPMLFKGDKMPLQFPAQWFIDVQDTARLHVAALIDPACNGQRVFGFAERYVWNKILAILRKNFPNNSIPDDVSPDEDLSKVPNEDAEALLQKHYGKRWTGIEEAVLNNVAQLA